MKQAVCKAWYGTGRVRAVTGPGLHARSPFTHQETGHLGFKRVGLRAKDPHVAYLLGNLTPMR